ncbi:MAG TPA: hypothetical protein PKE35_02820 [Anaerolineales bacterium]|nr:hypothetical protein [Anaerolineales bacterium]HMV98245.1 hypothetical protein [Anaerolineales bacterium]HMX18406.1 hypothetical protein [Anaerolineales bacterium]HMX73154.1 hypothetical protein [Anaerolineales bacterium]HMZ41557.1 hypothetical protein [Anaerolineales bacterium]
MPARVATFVFGIVFAVLFSWLPVYPLLIEGREISESGESLYQEWRFVPLAEYNDSAIFARSAWQKSVRATYVVTTIVNYLVLFGASWGIASLGVRIIKKSAPRLIA